MTRKIPEIFLDTSVIIAAVMSPTGGARLLFYLAQAGTVKLLVGSGVLGEAEEVMRCKPPESLGLLAQLLDEAGIEISKPPTAAQKKKAQTLLSYSPLLMCLHRRFRQILNGLSAMIKNILLATHLSMICLSRLAHPVM